MVSFAAIRPRRVAEEVVERIEERILDGTFAPDDRLPSEEQLAAQLGVGRRAVREALKVLETKGLIEVRMGVGATVRRNDLDSFLKALTGNVTSYLSVNRADHVHVMELRWLLEGAAFRRLVEDSQPERLERLSENVAEQQASLDAGDSVAYQDWHFQFHQIIVDALDNPIISMIHRQMLTLLRAPMQQAGTNPSVARRAVRDHAVMVDALRRRSMDDLQAILDRHLANFVSDLDHVDASERSSKGDAIQRGKTT